MAGNLETPPAAPATRSSPPAPGAPVRLLVVTTVHVTAHNFLAPHARHFRALGWRVDVAARDASADPLLCEAFDTVTDLPLSRSLRDVAALVRGYRAIARLLATGPDLVHVHTPIAGFLVRAAARRLPPDRRPGVVYTTHGFHFHRGGQPIANAGFLLAETVAGRWTDRLVVINDEDERSARAHRIVPGRRLARMPGIGVDTDHYARAALPAGTAAEVRTALGAGPTSPLFVFVGELNENKHPADAIRALAAMVEPDAELVLLGEGRARGALEALAAELGVGERVRFAGFADDVRPYLVAATALLLPSEREGLSRAIMEALALEVPVVASTARGNAELVRDDAGFVVGTGDVAAMTAAMEALAADPDAARAMGRAGRARMVERHDLRRVLALLEALYADVLAERALRIASRRG